MTIGVLSNQRGRLGAGDKTGVLSSVGVNRAASVVVAIPNIRDAKNTIAYIKDNHPDISIIARAYDRKSALKLREAGASAAIAEAFESSLALGSAVLKSNGISDHEIERVITEFREREYPVSFEEYVLGQALFHSDTPAKNEV